MSKQTCPECGARLPDGADRCDLCGMAVGVVGDQHGTEETAAPGPGPAGVTPDSPALEPGPEAGAVEPGQAGLEQRPAVQPAEDSPAIEPGPSSPDEDPAVEPGPASPDEDPAVEPGPASPDEDPAEDGERHALFCSQCGSENVPGSRFCSQCGARIHAAKPVPVLPPVRPAEGPESDEEFEDELPTIGVGRHLGIVIGSSLLLVIALFLINVVSSQTGQVQTGAASAPPQPAPTAPLAAADVFSDHAALPLTPEQQEAVSAIEDEIARLDGEARRAKQREVVELLAGFGRIDRAAIIQQEIAEAEDTPEAWSTAGDLLFDWMEAVGGEHQGQVAMLAIAAYQRVLEIEPDNLDVRAEMAWAYQYHPVNSMDAITQNNYVLERDPAHVQANFNRGIFLMRINRLEQAIQQFEYLQSLVGAEDPVYGQAEAMIEVIREALVQ
jgi:ribosomal protein L40E